MPKILALMAVLLLALTGCAGTPDTAPSQPQDSSQSTPAESTAPLVAEAPVAPTVDAADAAFLEYVRENVLPETQIPNATDAQLIAAGHDACAQLESGVALENVRVVDGETPHPSTSAYYDTSAIMGGAILSYCPEFS